MGVLGLRYEEISGKAGKPSKGDIEVTTSLPIINDMRCVEIGSGKQKKDVLIMTFSYTVNYMPTEATIEIKGELTYMDEDPKKIYEKWKKEKKIDEKVSLPVLNFLIKKCCVESIKIAEDLQLPPPVRLPEVKSK